LNYPTLSH